MIVFPMDKPVICAIHASYVDLSKLVQYYQNKIGSGCIHCRSCQVAGVLFFSSEKVTSGFFEGSPGHLEGLQAMDHLISVLASDNDLFVDVYELDKDRQFFWASLPYAKAIHRNLSTEFTDLLKLLKKMTAEKLTGYIDISLDVPAADGRIFLEDGKYIGCTMAEAGKNLHTSKTDLSHLIKKAGKCQGVFNVYQVGSQSTVLPEASNDPMSGLQPQTLSIMAEFLQVAEKLIARSKKELPDFQTLLKKQFVKNVDAYPFLDPFMGEFDYAEGVITFSGKASEKAFVKGVFVSVQAIFRDISMDADLEKELGPWRERYPAQLATWGLGYAN